MTIAFRDDMVPGDWRNAQAESALSEASRATLPPPSTWDITKQSFDDARRVSNQNALQVNMAEAYDDINDRIYAATKTRLANPLNALMRPLEGNSDADDPHEEWKRQVGELRLKHADALSWDDILSEPERRGYAKMKEVRGATDKMQEQLGLIQGREIPYLRNVPLVREVAALGANAVRSPLATAAQFAGGFAGAMTSPIDAGVNLLGFGAGGAAKSLLLNAVSNAAVNAVSQMPLSYLKMDDYKKAGLPHGFDVWLSEVEGAASAGAVIDAGIRGPVRAFRKASGATDNFGGVIFDAVPRAELPATPITPKLDISPETFQKASEEDLAATREILTKTGALDDPEIRGAMEHAEIYGKLDADMIARLDDMGVARADGFRILDGLLQGRYTRPADLQADVATMNARPQPAILDADAARVLAVAGTALDRMMPGASEFAVHALEARIPEVETLARTALAQLKEKGDPAEIARAFADEMRKVLQDAEKAPRITAIVRMTSGEASSVEMAQNLKAMPDLKSRLNPEIGRHAEALSLASLDDASLVRVTSGEVPTPVAAHIAEHVPPKFHTQAFDDMAKAKSQSLAEAVALLDELVPTEPRGETPLDRSGGSRIDDPVGAAAKAQTELLRQDAAEAIKAAQEPIKERDKLESKVETLKGEIAKLDDKMVALSESDATTLAKKRAELHTAETQLAESQARLNPDPESAQALYRVAMAAVAARREADVYTAVAHAVALGRKIAPEGTKIEVRSTEMRDDVSGNLLDAYYQKGESTIVLAKYASDPTARMSHEVVHALVDHNLLTPAEVKLLAQEAAKTDGVFTREMRKHYAKAYQGRDKLGALLDEEAAAHLIDARMKGKANAPENTVEGRVAQFVQRLRNLMKGYGFKTADDVAAAILNGDAARRSSVRQWMRGNDIPEENQIVRFADRMFALADRDTGQSMRRDLDALGYYSKALEAARSLKQAKGTPEQMLAQLKSAGVKQAEIDATNLAQFLDGKKSVTRDEIVAHLEANRVGVRERQYGNNKPIGQAEMDAYRAAHGLTDADRVTFDEVGTWMGDKDYAGLPKWSSYSLDPQNPTYRETVLHLPGKETGLRVEPHPNEPGFAIRGPDGELLRYPNSPEYPKPGAVKRWDTEDMARNAGLPFYDQQNFKSGHFPEPNIIGHMMTSMTSHEGKPVYTIDQIQSDWGQKLRDGGVRDEAKIAELKRQIEEIESSVDTSWLREGGGDWLHARETARDQLGREASQEMGFEDAIKGTEHARLNAELRTAEESSPGNPLVNTTDQWVNTTLRRAIRQAAEADADYIAIPTGKTVESYNPQGDSEGNAVFYEKIVPKNLKNLLVKIDKDAGNAIRADQLETPTKGMAGSGFTLFPLTDKVKQSVKTEGQAMFALADPVQFADGQSVSVHSYSSEPPVEGPAMRGMRMFAIRAYHGSPHDFDRFDMGKIGTGEGAQAYGHGLYFAESEGVAKSYRNKLSGPSAYDVKNPQHIAEQYLRGFSPQDASATLESSIQQLRQFGAKPDHLEAAKKLIDDGVVTKPAGSMYEVNIKADPDDFLDWDKPLSQQSEKVRGALDQMISTAKKSYPGLDESVLTGQGAIKAYTGHRGGNADVVSEAMREAGIPGIRYLDQGSRTAGEGTRNYVVFDDNLIEIVAKDGKPIDGAERRTVIDAMAAKPEGEGPMFAMRDTAEPRSILETEYAGIDRMNALKDLIEACRQ